MKRRDARKLQIETDRVQMQEGIKQQLEERRKARAGRDIDGEMAVIDQETDAKNKTVDASKDEQFKANEVAGLSRQQTIDSTTAGVQSTLAQMREEARIAREAGRQSPEDRTKERDTQVAAAQAEFDKAVETANAIKVEESAKSESPTPTVPPPKVPKPGDLKVPKVEVDGIKDPKLKPPKKKDLKLGLDRSAKDSIDDFSNGPEQQTEKTEAVGNFDSRGLGLGSGASTIPMLPLQTGAEPTTGEEDVDASIEPQAEVTSDDDFSLLNGDMSGDLETETMEPQGLNLEPVLAAFESVRFSLGEFDATLSQSISRMAIPQIAADGLSDDVKRAIIQTAENTKSLVERSRSGGFVFS
jgi:hypothetical protein